MVDPHYDIGIYIMIAISFVSGLFVLNWTITFYKLSKLNVPSISVRRPKSVILLGILGSFALLIRLPIQFILSFYPDIWYPIFWISTISAFITTIGIMYILIYHAYLCYYDIRWNLALEDEEWQILIATKLIKHSFYIRNRKTYGNPKYVGIIVFIPWFIYGLIDTIIAYIWSQGLKSKAVIVVAVLTVVFPLLIIGLKIPKFNDYFKLRRETKVLSLAISTAISTWFVVNFILKARIGQWKWLLSQLIHLEIIFAIAYISFYLVFKTFSLPKYFWNVTKYGSVKHVRGWSEGLSSGKPSTPTKDETINMVADKSMKLVDVLQDNELFRLYARHLSKEFAVENLLFFVETHQFVKYIETLLSVNGNQNELSDDVGGINAINKIRFAVKVPQSTIVNDLKEHYKDYDNYNINKIDMKNINIAAINLFLKFIDFDAYFLINISGPTRNALNNSFGFENIKFTNSNKLEEMNDCMVKNNVSLDQIRNIFNEPRKEIYTLLQRSFTRFTVNVHQ